MKMISQEVLLTLKPAPELLAYDRLQCQAFESEVVVA